MFVSFIYAESRSAFAKQIRVQESPYQAYFHHFVFVPIFLFSPLLFYLSNGKLKVVEKSFLTFFVLLLSAQHWPSEETGEETQEELRHHQQEINIFAALMPPVMTKLFLQKLPWQPRTKCEALLAIWSRLQPRWMKGYSRYVSTVRTVRRGTTILLPHFRLLLFLLPPGMYSTYSRYLYGYAHAKSTTVPISSKFLC